MPDGRSAAGIRGGREGRRGDQAALARRPNHPGEGTGAARRPFSGRIGGASTEGGTATGGGEAREAGGSAHDAADHAGRTAAGRGEAREANTVGARGALLVAECASLLR